MEEQRTLEKVNNNTYVLHITRNDGKQIITVKYTKAEMRENLDQIRQQKNVLMVQKKQNDEKLKKMTVNDTPQNREFLKKIQDAQLLSQKEKVENEQKMVLQDLERFDNEIKEIRQVIPEFFRDGKKT